MKKVRYTYCILIRLCRPYEDYKKGLIRAIRQLGDCHHQSDWCWLLATEKKAQEIRDELLPHIESEDEIVVLSVGLTWSSWNLNEDAKKWLNKNWFPATMVDVK